MLDALRRGATTWVAKLFLMVLVASFAVWGIADVFRGGSTRYVASVGDTDIDALEFQRVYTQQLQNMSRQMGQPIDGEMSSMLGIPQRVLDQMIADAALTDAAKSLGLGISDEALAKKIADDPNLRPPGASGFDRFYFSRLLQENGMTEPQYVANRRVFETRQQLLDGVADGVKTPEVFIEAVHRYRNEVRNVDYVVLTPRMVPEAGVPADDVLATWYEENKSTFDAPELRDLSVLHLSPASIADPSAVSDEDAQKEYDRAKNLYVTPEQRRIQQIIFPTIEEATAAADKLSNGVTFDTLLTDRGLTAADSDLGLISRDKVLDPAIADAAFALAPNAVSAPIAARFGGALVRVTEIVPEVAKPFDSVKAEIKTSVANRLAERAVLDTQNEIEDARAGGATLQEIADRFKLKLVKATVDANGNDASGQPVALPEQSDLLAKAFASDIGVDNDAIHSGRDFVWFEVTKVQPSRERPLDEVKDKAITAWQDEENGKALAAAATKLADDLKAGGDFATLATAAGAAVEKLENITRNSDQPALGGGGVDAAFDGAEGLVTTSERDDGAIVVMKVTNRIVPPFFAEAVDSVDAGQRLRDELGSSLIEQYLAELKTSLGATVNQQVLNTIVNPVTR